MSAAKANAVAVLAVGYPGGTIRQISLPQEQVAQVRRCLTNYHKLKAAHMGFASIATCGVGTRVSDVVTYYREPSIRARMLEFLGGHRSPPTAAALAGKLIYSRWQTRFE